MAMANQTTSVKEGLACMLPAVVVSCHLPRMIETLRCCLAPPLLFL